MSEEKVTAAKKPVHAKPVHASGQPPAPQPVAQNPGEMLGIIGLVLNFVGINIAGIVLGILSRNKSKEAGQSTTLGTISLVWGIVGTVLGALAFIMFVILMIFAMAADNSAPGSMRHMDYDNYSSSTL